MSYMGKMDNTSVYSAENDHMLVNNQPSYTTMNHYFTNTKCPYTSGPGQAVVKPIYIDPNKEGGYEMLVANFLPTQGNTDYYTISTGYPFPPLAYAPVPLTTEETIISTDTKSSS